MTFFIPAQRCRKTAGCDGIVTIVWVNKPNSERELKGQCSKCGAIQNRTNQVMEGGEVKDVLISLTSSVPIKGQREPLPISA
jgi:hypothetical protein